MNRVVFATSFMLAASVAFALSPAFAGKQRLQDGGWILTVRHDDFAKRIRCDLVSRNHRMRYQPGAIGFRMGSRRDTTLAWYRVDERPPVRWQDRTAALIGAGVILDGPRLDNPTGGWVWVPMTEVEKAREVAIRTSGSGHGRNFRMAGFDAILAGAKRSGCGSDDAFRI